MKRIWILLSMFMLIVTAACTGAGEEQQMMDGQMTENIHNSISSDFTETPSDVFPHTQAILINPAEYIYTEVEEWDQHGQSGQDEQQAQPGQDDQQYQHSAPTNEIGQLEMQVVELTNQERRNHGLSPLEVDHTLANVAREKSNDMHQNNYFSHTSPTHGSPFDMIRDMGVSYTMAAENIAHGQTSAEQVVQQWMESPGHRQNILNEQFTHIGVGYQPNGHHWTQMFILK